MKVCEGRFPFLGYGTVGLGRQPRWNVDFVSGLDWLQIPLENRHCMRFDGSDVKVPYELSRLQFLPVLGKAHVITGEERYREVAKTCSLTGFGKTPSVLVSTGLLQWRRAAWHKHLFPVEPAFSF